MHKSRLSLAIGIFYAIYMVVRLKNAAKNAVKIPSLIPDTTFTWLLIDLWLAIPISGRTKPKHGW